MSSGRSFAGLALVLAFAVLGLALALSETFAARDLAEAGETEVDRHVPAARAALEEELAAVERAAAATAERALSSTADQRDRTALFGALLAIPLPPRAGVRLEDADGRVLAWAGVTIDDAAFDDMPRTSDGTSLVVTQAARCLAVRRTRSSPLALEGVPFLAVCHIPVAETFPLRSRALAPWSLEQEVAARFRVAGDVRVLPPDAAAGEPVKSAFGGALARVTVKPLSARSWDEAVQRDAERRRTWILAMLTVTSAAAALRTVRRRLAPAAAHAAAAAVILAARAALGLLPLSSAFDLGALTDAARYSHPLPLDLAASPLSLAATAAAICAAAIELRRAATERARERAAPWLAFGAAALTALACRAALAEVADDVVTNSGVEFFSAESVLPGAAAAALFVALFAMGTAAVLLTGAVHALLVGRAAPRAGPALAASAVLAAMLVPLGPASPHAVGLAAAGITGAAVALAADLAAAPWAMRLAAIPLGVSVAVFAPLESGLFAATRAEVERAAARHVSRTVAAERLFVSDTLDGVAADPALAAALAAPRLPRDLALTLWSRSQLARRAGGSSLEIEPPTGDPQLFSADLPPRSWLPLPAAYPPADEVSAEPLAGEGLGRNGRWIVGSRSVTTGTGAAAVVRVFLEVRPPSPALPELQVLGASGAPDLRAAPRLAVSRYATDGRLVSSDDPYRPAGTQLDATLLAECVTGARAAWRAAPQADRELDVLVRPDLEDDDVVGLHAFSYDTGGAWSVLLHGTRAALSGGVAALLALAATLPVWIGNVRLRLAQRLVVSYVLVAALPLLFLGWANRAIALRRVDETTRRELGTAISLLRAALHEDPRMSAMRDLPPRPYDVKDLRLVAYTIGHHANAFLDARLVATSDQGLFDTALLPTRLPGDVYRDVILLGQPFASTAANVGGYEFDVGYAPWRDAADDKLVGAVSVPLLHQSELKDRELASAMTAVLGLYLASLVAAISLGTLLASRMTKPLSDLTDAARRVAKGDVERPVPGGGPDELGEVVAAFNQMQRDLGESRAKLVKAEKEAAWRDMARQVAHEVKNPLTPMRLSAEHLRRAWRDKVPNFGEVLERGVDLIVRQTESLQRIATAFGDFARFPNRRREPVDLAALLDEVLDLNRDTPDLAIVRRIARPLPTLLADPDELRRVLVNLVKNAAEALEGRKGTLTATLERRDAELVLTLADDGPGIPDEILPRLFEPYLSTKTKGTGLGLAIVKRAVEDLSGTIRIESRAGAGTTVTVRLPLPA